MRIAYVILTCEKYTDTRRVWQMDTVFRTAPREDIFYLGGRTREADRVFSWGAPDDYVSLPLKFVDFFVRTELGGKYDWFFFMDDDTYLYLDRLERRMALLEEGGVDPQKDVYAEGSFMTHIAHTQWGVYPSGGAGTLLSAEAYRQIQERLRRLVGGGSGATYTPPHDCADICMGRWIKSLDGHRMIHYDGYHPEMARAGQGEEEEDITFHHLKEKEDFWAHWHIGQRKGVKLIT